MQDLIQTVLIGLLFGGVYSLVALGLNTIFGVMKIVNVAHGDFLMLGAYTSFWLFAYTGVTNPLAAVPTSMGAGFVLGLIVYKLLVTRVSKAPELTSLLLMFGISILITNGALAIWTAEYRGVPHALGPVSLAGIPIPSSYLIACLFAVCLAGLLHGFLQYTSLGKYIRAVSQNRDVAMLMGIDVSRVSMIVFGIGVAMAFASGSLVMLVSPAIHPYIGAQWTLLAFCVAVLGGLGDQRGCILGGFALGLLSSLAVRYFLRATLAPALAFAVLVLTLLLKPQGILGRG